MEHSARKSLLGGIFNHLVTSLVIKENSRWENHQIGGAYDKNRVFPFLIFGDCETRPWRSVTFDGDHHRLYLELYSGDAEHDKTEGYVTSVINTMNDADFPIKGYTLIELQYEKTQYIKKANKNENLVRLLFTILTVCD